MMNFSTTITQSEKNDQHTQPIYGNIFFSISAVNPDEQPVCSICLCSVDLISDDYTLTLCKHTFHCGCLYQLKEKGSSTCPVCREPLRSEFSSNISPSSSSNLHHQNTIIQAANRGRNAVRLAMERKQTTEVSRRNPIELFDPVMY